MTVAITEIKGIGAQKGKLFAKVGIRTVTDLLQYFPRAYEDRSHIVPIGEAAAAEGLSVLINGTVSSVTEVRPRRGMTILKVFISDSTGAVELIWFNRPFKKRMFRKGMEVHAFGKIERRYGRLQMNSPEAEPGVAAPGGLVPVYALTDGLYQNDFRKAVNVAFAYAKEYGDVLPACLSAEVTDRAVTAEMYKAIHFPPDFEVLKKARKILAFEELFSLQAGLLLKRQENKAGRAVKFGPNGKLVKGLLNNLPFTLTQGQIDAFLDIQNDVETESPMQRLIQGDVGSGKTVVAALALAKTVENGYQGALMAPTGILAAQHYEEFTRLFTGLPVTVALLTGRSTAKERAELLRGLANRDIDILVGTHALIQEDVVFADLALAVTDEQHRFGVKQRVKLRDKGKAPHSLYMTATPIPRTLALSVYGDLDVSTIREVPPGRKPVKTYAVGEGMRARVYAFMKKRIAEGQQVYVVCPLVEESESADLQAASALYEDLSRHAFKEYRCGLVHGRMSGKEKDAVMDAFRQGDLNILVATSVIEVGVNVPNASVMVILDAQRFGLSQLHQLRGRVGRGAEQSFCILVTSHKLTTETRRRIDIMCDTNDGFEIAEADLKLRGPGRPTGCALPTKYCVRPENSRYSSRRTAGPIGSRRSQEDNRQRPYLLEK